MKFVADVNITQTVIKFLRQSQHKVIDVKTSNPKMTDIEIIKLTITEDAIILTHDRDFEALTQYPKCKVGTIVIRLKIQNAQHHCKKLQNLLDQKTEDILKNSLTIIQEEKANSYPY